MQWCNDMGIRYVVYITVHNCIVSVLGKPTLWIHIGFVNVPTMPNVG